MKTVLFVALALFAAAYAGAWLRSLVRRPATGADRRIAPTFGQTAIGFGTNFFDTLGIGSFAPTATIYKLVRMVPDALIPGTMNAGHTLPVVVMAYIYIAIVEVDSATLVALIAAAVAGARLGADLVSGLPRRPIQLGIAAALVVAAALMVMSQIGFLPVGGSSLGLTATTLAFAAAGSFVLGALNTIGVGFYGPCMIMVALLGMDPRAAFPIMMGSCAFLMPVGSARFVQRGAYCPRAALGLTLGGIPAVFIAAYLVGSLPLDGLRWLVVVVALYTAVVMLRSAASAATPE